ncbi:Hsp20/alpha crystallin family protein [Chloroflexota bacterium]
MNILVRRNDGEQTLVPFYSPLSLLGAMDRMDRFAGNIWDSSKPYTFDTSLVPHTDIYEENDQLVMKTELPGINREDVNITLQDDRLTIKAEKKEVVIEEDACYTRERQYGQYLRSVTLPFPVKEDKISATFENGVLELRLSKAEESKARKIEIKARLTEGKQENSIKAKVA